MSAPYPSAVVTENVEAAPCVSAEPLPVIPQLTQIVPQPSAVVIDAPYPRSLPFPTHYGEPVVPLQYLLLNNSI